MDPPLLDPKVRRAMHVREIFTGEVYRILWRIKVMTLGQLEDADADDLVAKGLSALEIAKVIKACEVRQIRFGEKKTPTKSTSAKGSALHSIKWPRRASNQPGQTDSPPPFRLRMGRKVRKPIADKSIDGLKLNSAKRLRAKEIRTNGQLAACTRKKLKEEVGLSDRQIATIQKKLANIGLSLLD